MFLIAVTRKPITFAEPLQSRLVNCGNWNVTFAWSGKLPKVKFDGDHFILVESAFENESAFQHPLTTAKFDSVRRTLSLAKTLGAGRPLYYHLNSSGEFFASTHISLLKSAGVPIDEDKRNVPEYVTYRYVVAPQTLYRDIRKLAATGELTIELTDSGCKIQKEVSFNPPPKSSGYISLDRAWPEVLRLLQESLAPLSDHKNRVAVPLSGGIDSTLLFQICKQDFGITKSYSTHFPFEKRERDLELDYALTAAKEVGANHHVYNTTLAKYLSYTLRAIAASEEPLGHLHSGIFADFFANALPESEDIIVSGQGAGTAYGVGAVQKYFLATRWPQSLLIAKLFRYGLAMAAAITGKGKGLARAAMRGDFDEKDIHDPRHVVWRMHEFTDAIWIRSYFGMSEEQVIENRVRAFSPFVNRGILDLMTILDFFGDGEFTQAVWSKIAEDANRMILYPFSDQAVMEYLYSVPWEVRMTEPKAVLTKASISIGIPSYIMYRKKTGFNTTTNTWSMYGGPYDALAELASKVIGRDSLDQLRVADDARAMTFWTMVNYAIWKRIHIDNEPLADLQAELAGYLSKKNT